MEEIWRDIPFFAGKYQASNTGRIRSLMSGQGKRKRPYILYPYLNKYGYYQVCLVKSNKKYTRRIHRLVLLAFSNLKSNYLEVNHIDGNKVNNRIDNLEWCTRLQNMRHAHGEGLIKKPKIWKGS